MKKLFCAHRGVSALMPENTLPAFAAALIADALAVRGVQVSPVLNEDSIRTELLSFELIKKFVQRKMPAHSS